MLISSVVIVTTVWLIILLIITFPKSDQNITKSGAVAYVPYGSTLVVSYGKSTMTITPSKEKIEKKIYFIVLIPSGIVDYSENTTIPWGPFVSLKVKKVSGGIEVTKPWLASFR